MDVYYIGIMISGALWIIVIYMYLFRKPFCEYGQVNVSGNCVSVCGKDCPSGYICNPQNKTCEYACPVNCDQLKGQVCDSVIGQCRSICGDCGLNAYCDPDLKKCVPKNDCKNNQIPDLQNPGKCIDVCSQECPEGQTCNLVSKKCENPCGADCPQGSVCNRFTKTCVSVCGNCDKNQYCDTKSKVCKNLCGNKCILGGYLKPDNTCEFDTCLLNYKTINKAQVYDPRSRKCEDIPESDFKKIIGNIKFQGCDYADEIAKIYPDIN